MQLTYYFALDSQIYEAEKLLPEVDKKNHIDCYSFFRDVCSSSLLRNPVKLRGSGINSQIIEIDESLFWQKKRKYHRGTGRQYYWVFGMVERNSRKAVMQLVERRNTDTLLPNISNYASE